MDYQELWNQLKGQMLEATKKQYDTSVDVDTYLFHADTILRRMVALELEQYNDMKTRQQELDLKFTEMLFSQKGE